MTAACWQIYMWRVYDDDTGWSVNAPPSDWDGGRGATEEIADSLWLVVTQKGEVALKRNNSPLGFPNIKKPSQDRHWLWSILFTFGHLLAKWPFSPHLKQVISSRVLNRWGRPSPCTRLWNQVNIAKLINRFHKIIYGIVRYHGMHPVVALGVRHEGLPQLVHLLVFQLLNQEVVLKGSRNWRGKSPGAFYGSETLCARLLHNSGKLSQPRVDTSQMLDTSKMAELWSTNLFAHFRVHVRRAWQFKPGMGICAFGSCRAKSCQVVDAEHPAHMSVPAVGTVPTEACSIWSFSSLLWS